MDEPRTDEELLAAVNGEPEAFGVAETFAAALAGGHRVAPARGPASAWLYGIARRRSRAATPPSVPASSQSTTGTGSRSRA